MGRRWDGSENPTPPAARLVETADVVVERVQGRPRSATDGRHRLVVVLVRPELSALVVAGHLRAAAAALEKTVLGVIE